MVVDFTVDGKDQFTVSAFQRLATGSRVDDGKTFAGEDGGFTLINPAPVRAAVTDTFTHFKRLLSEGGGSFTNVEDCCNATHNPVVLFC